jgi:heptosyltransferase II
MTVDRSQVRRVVVLSPNWLGDAVMALPAIADLKRHFTGARLIVAARRSVAEIFRLAPVVDEVIVLEWKGHALRRQALSDDVDKLRGLGAEIAVLLPNAFSAAWVVKSAGIPNRWGYASDLRSPLLTRAVARPTRSVHQGEYYQHLIRTLGIQTGPREPTLVVPGEATDAARALLRARGWDPARPLVAMAPGAAYGTAKRWMPEHYATLATTLVTVKGAQCALVGSAGDAETTSWIRGLVPDAERPHVIDLAGATTLPALVGAIALARTFVSNDSGAMHVASAIGVPVTALFGPTRDYETHPLARPGVPAEVLLEPVWCRPCMLRECPIDHRCMKRLSPDRVFAVVASLMSS